MALAVAALAPNGPPSADVAVADAEAWRPARRDPRVGGPVGLTPSSVTVAAPPLVGADDALAHLVCARAPGVAKVL